MSNISRAVSHSVDALNILVLFTARKLLYFCLKGRLFVNICYKNTVGKNIQKDTSIFADKIHLRN